MSLTCEIIAIGNEVLVGDVINSNAATLSQALTQLGYQINYHTTLGDDEATMLQAFRLATKRAQLVMVTGGLGPTSDDFTLEVFAQFLKVPLQRDLKIAKKIERFFKKSGRAFTPNQLKQADFPKGSIVLQNPLGTAPGIYRAYQRTHFFFLPGVPAEMSEMFSKQVLPILKKKMPVRQKVRTKVLRCFGIPEGALDYALKTELMERVKLLEARLAFQVKFPDILLKISSSGSSENEVKRKLKTAKARILEKVGNYVYGEGEPDLAVVVGKRLKQSGKTLAVAESCTGGYLSDWLTNQPGASDFFLEGLTCYANSSKISRCCVQSSILVEQGAVSREVAIQMASGIRRQVGADFGIGITGIAGPSGGTAAKPVGTVHVAIASRDEVWDKKFVLPFGRKAFKKVVAAIALDKLRKMLL